MMDSTSLYTAFEKARERIAWFWNFYLVAVVAIFGWFLSPQAPVDWRVRLVISAGYVAFAAMNLHALRLSYVIASSLREDLLAALDAERAAPSLRRALSGNPLRGWKIALPLIHAVVGFGVLVILWR